MNKNVINQDTDTAVELHRALTASLVRRFSLSERAASALADEIAAEFRRECGGREIYIPAVNRDLRNRLICQEFNGRNHDELATQHGLSRSRIYEIVRTK
ncbi:MAG TPA: Mor transcription activator family protein [Guyparkeria sp.]|nr:Mor transcription activator family protein [Guyparkeria sp.]